MKVLIFPNMFCDTQILTSFAKLWHKLGKTTGNKEASRGTEEGNPNVLKVVKTKKEGPHGGFAMSVLKERNDCIHPIKIKGGDVSQQNEVEEKDEDPEWSTIYYATDIC